jgi:hypothetical protein
MEWTKNYQCAKICFEAFIPKKLYMKLDVKKVTQSFSSTFSTEDSQALVILAHCLGLQVDHAEAPDP